MEEGQTQRADFTGATEDFLVPLSAISTPTLVLTPDFTMVAANEARLRVTMGKREDIIGRFLFDVFPDNPNDVTAEGVRNLRASLGRVLRDKVPDAMPVQKYDIPKPESEGGEFEVRYWSPINIPILGPGGEVTHILHQVEDVTEVMLGNDRLQMMTSEIYARTNEVRSVNAALKIAKEELEIKIAERTAALAASEKRFRGIANAMPQIVWTATAEGLVNWYNDWWYEYSGALPDSSGDKNLVFMHPDDIESSEKRWRDSLASAQTFQAEFRLKRKSDGQYRWHLGRAVPVRDGKGTVVHWVGSETDIHDQKVAKARFQNLLETVPHLVWRMNPLGEIEFISRQWKEYTGTEINTDSNGRQWMQLIHPEDTEFVSEAIKSAAENLGTLVMPAHRIKKADGSYRWNLGHGNPIFDNEGEFKGWIGTTTDVHEQKNAEDALKESEARFRAVTDAVPGGIYIADSQGGMIYQNQRFWDYVDESPDEAEGWKWRDLTIIHPDDLQQTIERWNTAVNSGAYYETEYRLRGRDGEYRWFLSRAFPYRNENGEIVRWYGTNTDIHEQKLLAEQLNQARQAAESANATKSAFLANMSHEIRTPLAAIIGFSELLRETNLSPEERDQYLETVIRSSHGLTRIIDDILDLAKVEAGKLDIEEIEFSLFDFMQEVVDLFRDKARQKGIYLFLNVDEDVPEHIISDPTRLRQILVNLIGNALKFTTKGGVRVSVKASSQGDGRMGLAVSVKDTGIGLSAAQKEKLFQPFVQADNSTTREYGGTGLGLVLSRRLANALEGDIRIAECKEGNGCTFILSFLAGMPEQAVRGTSDAKRQDPDVAGRERLSNIKILLADDSTDNQFLIARVLTKYGATVVTANDGEEAIRKAMDAEFDLVLMDIQMPRVDGYEATKALRSNGYNKPIIALTAHAMAEERARTRAAGCTGHLTKPINQPELIDTIEQLASRTRAHWIHESRMQ